MTNKTIKRVLSIFGISLISVILLVNYTKTESLLDDSFNLPKLPYSYDSLEPYIDAKTMEIHHSKHHGAYVERLNESINQNAVLKNKTIEYLLTNLETLPDDIRESIRNNGGGHYNHSLFWSIMGKGNKVNFPKGELAKDIDNAFGSFENFQQEFNQAATKTFGSGWVWLIKDIDDTLKIISTPNQDTPLITGASPILILDLWEHAYYLKYKNKRVDYIDNWWHVVNWNEAEKKYLDSTAD